MTRIARINTDEFNRRERKELKEKELPIIVPEAVELNSLSKKTAAARQKRHQKER